MPNPLGRAATAPFVCCGLIRIIATGRVSSAWSMVGRGRSECEVGHPETTSE